MDVQDLTELFTRDAQVQIVSPAEDIISKRVLVHELNLHTATDAQLDFDVAFKLVIDLRCLVFPFSKLYSAACAVRSGNQSVLYNFRHCLLSSI